MSKQILLAMALAAATNPALAMSDAECSALMNKPGVYIPVSSGKLSPAYSEAYIKSGRTMAPDEMIDPAKFMDACKADVFKTVNIVNLMSDGAKSEPDAPFPGANSFTETQAKERIEKAGFTGVSGLKKDEQGIWRGTAMQGNANTPIALDFKGNVVAK